MNVYTKIAILTPTAQPQNPPYEYDKQMEGTKETVKANDRVYSTVTLTPNPPKSPFSDHDKRNKCREESECK